MSKADDLARQLLVQRVETIEALKGICGETLGRKNADGRPLRGMMRVMHDHEMSHQVQVQKTRAAAGALPTEVQMILAQCLQARAAFAAALVGLTDEQLDAKPGPDAWSVGQMAEHLLRYDPVLIERIKTQFGDAK
jgi:hypothetical protein